MTVLVTGGAGYIGSHMVLELLDAGEDVVVIDNLSTGFRWALSPDVPLFIGDIADDNLTTSVFRKYQVSAVIHFAGSIVVPESVADPLRYYLNNTAKSRALIEYAIHSQVPHFIFSSTAAVYGSPERNPVNERARLAPVSPYGSSKMMTEVMLRDVSRAHGMEFVALRYFNVCGADPASRSGQSSPKATHLIKVACETALGKRPHMEIFGTDYDTPDGTAIRDYIHVKDLTRAHLAALSYLRAGGKSDVFNCGYSRGYSVREVIGAVKRISAVDFKVLESARRPGDPPILVADNSKIQHAMKWEPQQADLDTIVGHALAWERRLSVLRANE